MAVKYFQGFIMQMKDVIARTVGVLDRDGNIVACSAEEEIGKLRIEAAAELAKSAEEYVKHNGVTYRTLPVDNAGANSKYEYAVFAAGEDEYARLAAGILSVSVGNVKAVYDEKHDSLSFVKNVLMDNIMSGDFFSRAKELHIDCTAHRAVFVIKISDENTNSDVINVVRGLFPNTSKDYIIDMNETDIVLVKEVQEEMTSKDTINLGLSVESAISGELMIKPVIGISSIVTHLKDLSAAYMEAQSAIEIGSVFDEDKTVISYENLGVGRLIYQLPESLCKTFLYEIFKKDSLEVFDRDTLATVYNFFENNLNVSETSRSMFVHRNTLVYRLEKIKKMIGLDLREFDDAVAFKVALLVGKYLESLKRVKK